MRFLPLLAALLALAVSTEAVAQNADSEVRAELAERFVDITARENLEKIMAGSIEQEAQRLTQLNEAQRAWYSENALPILMPHLNAMVDDLEAQYAAAFTADELRAMVEFYDTPQGRAIAQKQNEVGAEVGSGLMTIMRDYVTDLRTKFCAAFECPATPSAGAASKGVNRG